jgi:hypothetical protein
MTDEANSAPEGTEEENSLPESADAETQETVETTEAEAEEDKPRKPTAKDRIDELTRLRREAERDAEYWKAKALQPEAPQVHTPAATPSAPDPEKYEAGEFDSRYIKDLARYEAKQEVAEAMAAAKAEQQQGQSLAVWTSRLNAAAETYSDFEEKVVLGAQRNEWACSPEMGEALRASEKGPDIAYQLATNPAEAARISRLSPALQYMELGKLEAKLAQPKPKTVTSAPEPTTQVRGSGGKFVVDPSTDDFAAFDKQYGGS